MSKTYSLITIVRLQVQGIKKYFLLKQYHLMAAKSNLEYTLHKPMFVQEYFDSLILWFCHLCEGKSGKVAMKISVEIWSVVYV